MPHPDVLDRNGTFVGVPKYQSRVGTFNRFLHEHARTEHERELLAAKLVSRWRSGDPLTLAPHDDPALGADAPRNNSSCSKSRSTTATSPTWATNAIRMSGCRRSHGALRSWRCRSVRVSPGGRAAIPPASLPRSSAVLICASQGCAWVTVASLMASPRQRDTLSFWPDQGD
jgi:hypothetical protein